MNMVKLQIKSAINLHEGMNTETNTVGPITWAASYLPYVSWLIMPSHLQKHVPLQTHVTFLNAMRKPTTVQCLRRIKLNLYVVWIDH